MNLVEGVQEEIKRVTAIIQEYSKYEGGQRFAACRSAALQKLRI